MFEKLVNGIASFQKDVFPEYASRFRDLADGQHPDALFITCSDSRTVPSLVTQTLPGDLFVVRNAGNIVPAHGPSNGADAAAVEFAVAGLGVRHVIVCGHSHCGAMQALLDPDNVASMPAVSAWIEHARDATSKIDVAAADALDRLIEQNVLLQLQHLKTHPAVERALANAELSLHGWVYRFETGEVLAFDRAVARFVPIGEIDRPQD